MKLKKINRLLLLSLSFMVIIVSVALATEAREIVINIPQLTLYLYENGIVVKQYPIGIGNEIKPSITGKTEIINLVVNPTYYPTRWWERGIEPIPPGSDNPVGTRWIGLGFQGYGIHGTNNPHSIGQAMSSGCFRMYNDDVEELMDLVKVGTPVSIIYQTIIVDQDPLLNTKNITVYKDVYTKNATTIDNVKQVLQQRGWSDIHLPVLEYLLKDAYGSTKPLPLSIDYLRNGDMADNKAVKYGNNYYIPLDESFSGVKVEYSDFYLWSEKYVNVVEVANIHGLGYHITDQIDLFDVTLTLFNDPIGMKAFILDNQLYLPIDELSEQISLPVPVHIKDIAMNINGKPHISQFAAQDWGIKLDWQYPQMQADLKLPQVYLDQQLLGIAFVGIDNEVYVPLNPIVELVDGDFTIDEIYEGEALYAGELIYVPDWVVRWMMPGAEISVVNP